MNKQNNKQSSFGSPEKMVFELGEQRSVNAIHHYFIKEQKSHYDMHYGLELGILLKGKMRRYYHEYQTNLLPGQTWLCGMWEPHGWQVFRCPCEAVVLIIYPPALTRVDLGMTERTDWILPFTVPPRLRPQCPKKDRGNIVRLAQSINCDDLSKLKLTQLKLLEILLILCEKWQSPETTHLQFDFYSRVNKAVNLVFNTESVITTQQAAAFCNMSRNAFAKAFKQTMGLSFSEFGMRYRISSAANQIRNTTLPMKTIAARFGFTDTSHLHRCFVRYYGQKPSDYRSKLLTK